MPEDSKSYSQRKYCVIIIEMFYNLALLLVFLGTGLCVYLESSLAGLGLRQYPLAAFYLLCVTLLYYLLNLPLNFYSGYALEHKFHLSRQTPAAWFFDQFKSAALGYILSLVLVLAFYWVLGEFTQWWLVISMIWIIFTLVLAKLAPVLIIPLFFKYKKLEDEKLREAIFELAKNMRVKLLDVLEIDFSKKTIKANAAFTGMGRTKRVLLADTLKDKYTREEVQVILAHEFAHYRLKHVIKLIVLNSLAITGLCYLIFKTSPGALALFNLSSLRQPASLPLIFLYFTLLGLITMPLEAFISRHFERQADSLALKVTGAKEAFISTMEKLAAQNLADRSPHPLIKFFFFSHPPIDERIASAKE